MASSVKNCLHQKLLKSVNPFQVTINNFGVLFDIFSFISTYSVGSVSPGSAETDNGCGGILDGYLLASCARNIYQKWLKLDIPSSSDNR